VSVCVCVGVCVCGCVCCFVCGCVCVEDAYQLFGEEDMSHGQRGVGMI
jgi:hypothetical protein